MHPRVNPGPMFAFVLTLLLVGGATPAGAQDFRGTILGRVTDPLHAAIPGAAVLVVNEATGVRSQAFTAADGAYRVPFLIPGKYRVEVTLSGFKTFIQSGITVGVTQNVSLDVRLELGDYTESVIVIGESTLLDRTTGSLGQIIDRMRVEAMPLNGRMVFMLNRLAGGVNWQVPTFGATGTSGLRPFDNNGGSAWSMNGGRVATNEFLLDGAPNSTRGRYNFAPPVDAVEEFKIQTNTYDAQYGRTGGGVVNMTLKSGSNAFHLQTWDFFKDEALNANNALNVVTNQAKPPYVANQYGVTARGPIVRNRTFFMTTFEGLRERVPFPTTTSVPTLAERRGDFTQSYTDQAAPLIIYDPLTTTCNTSGVCSRTAFPGNVIPANRINPAALAILNKIYPAPTIPDQRLNNYVNPVNKAKYDYDSEIVRIDHAFSDSSRVFLSAHRNLRDEYRSNNGLQGTMANQGQWPQRRVNRGGTVDWVKTIGANSLLNMRAGYSWFTEEAQQGDAKAFDRSQLPFTNLPGNYMPVIDLQQYTSIGVGSDGRSPDDRTASVQGNFTRRWARQTLKAGAEYRRIQARPITTGDYNGTFSFTRGYTQRNPNAGDSVSGNSVASFLLGYPSSGQFGGGQERIESWNYVAAYLQDDYRISPRLTLNLGLRWDYESAPVESKDRLIAGFAADAASPLAASVRTAPGASGCPSCSNLRGGLQFAGVDGTPRSLFGQDRNNIQPRAGFAFSINDKSVLRGGYGLYYAYRSQLGSQTGFFVTTPYIAGDLGGRVGIPETTVNTFSNPFPGGALQAPGSSLGLMTQVGRGISFDDRTNKLSYIHQYNLTVTRELTHNLMVEVSYVGSRTGAVSTSRNINAISVSDMAQGAAYLQATVTNPFAGLLPGTTRNGATIQRQELLRPYPQFGDITKNALSIGKTRYNGLQIIVQKRVSLGLTFTSSYTYSRTTERTSFLNAQDASPVKQVTDYDRPHIWVFSGVYELPFGKGRAIGGSVNRLVDTLIGGWQVNWNLNWQSGRPLGTPGSLEPIPGKSARLDNPTPERWFNTCYTDLSGNPQKCLAGEEPVWRQRPNFTLRTTPNRFNDIRVPWEPTLDASLFKHVPLRGRLQVELRLEVFNLLNTVILPAPNTTYNDANFGRIATPRGSVYFPRNVQLGVKLSY